MDATSSLAGGESGLRHHVTNIRIWYYTAKYAFWAWLDKLTGWRWVNDAAWDAVAAKHDASGAFDELAKRLNGEIDKGRTLIQQRRNLPTDFHKESK